MDKGLFFMTLSLACVWLILDDFFGNNRISKLVSSLIPNDFGKINLIPPILDPTPDPKKTEEDKKKAKDKVDNGETVTPPALPGVNGHANDQKTKDDIKKQIDALMPTLPS